MDPPLKEIAQKDGNPEIYTYQDSRLSIRVPHTPHSRDLYKGHTQYHSIRSLNIPSPIGRTSKRNSTKNTNGAITRSTNNGRSIPSHPYTTTRNGDLMPTTRSIPKQTSSGLQETYKSQW